MIEWRAIIILFVTTLNCSVMIGMRRRTIKIFYSQNWVLNQIIIYDTATVEFVVAAL